MPEGDTLFRAARTLRRVLVGRRVRACRSPMPSVGPRAAQRVGTRVRAVESRGKNLLVRFDDGHVLRTHLRMTGSWHVYRPGEAWRKPERRACFVLETDDAVAVCFSAPVVELMSEARARRHRPLEVLGPDLLDPGIDVRAAAARLRGAGDTEVGEALMCQRLVSGIGNVYKSETLFACGVSPFVPVGALTEETAVRLVETARDLMRRNLGMGPRRTRGRGSGGRYRVYRRRGRPCLRCGAEVRMRRQGAAARSTYFCEVCQPAGRGGQAGPIPTTG